MTTHRIDQADLLRGGALGPFQETGRKVRPEADAAPVAHGEALDRSAVGQDRAEISEAARRLMEIAGALEVGKEAVRALPDVRSEKVAEAMRHLEQGFHQSAEVRNEVAEGVSRVVEGMEEL